MDYLKIIKTSLLSVFDKTELTFNNYHELFGGEYSDKRGKSAIFYNETYNISGFINFIEKKEIITFSLEVEEKQLVFQVIPLSEFSKDICEYFVYIIKMIKEVQSEINKMVLNLYEYKIPMDFKRNKVLEKVLQENI